MGMSELGDRMEALAAEALLDKDGPCYCSSVTGGMFDGDDAVCPAHERAKLVVGKLLPLVEELWDE